MTKKIRVSPSTQEPIVVKESSMPRVEASHVAAALGADPSPERLTEALAPLTLFALREELVNRLQSSGGGPALAGVTHRVQVPLGDKEWLELEELAAVIASPGFVPSAGQVARALLTLSVHTLAAQVSRSSSLARELAMIAAGEAPPDRDSV